MSNVFLIIQQNSNKTATKQTYNLSTKMSYTMMNGNVVLLSYKNKMEAVHKTKIVNDVNKVREVKKAMVQLLVLKKSYMDIDEKMKFLSIDEKLQSWIDNQNGDITGVVIDALNTLKSYNRPITL